MFKTPKVVVGGALGTLRPRSCWRCAPRGADTVTLLLSNEEVDRALTHADAIAATEAIFLELAKGKAINRPRTQTYMPVESKEHPGFKYRFKSQEGGGVGERRVGAAHHLGHGGFLVHQRRQAPPHPARCDRQPLLRPGDPVRSGEDRADRDHARRRHPESAGRRHERRGREVSGAGEAEGARTVRQRLAGERASRISVQSVPVRADQSLQPEPGALPRVLLAR